jgi:hypothetical protein
MLLPVLFEVWQHGSISLACGSQGVPHKLAMLASMLRADRDAAGVALCVRERGMPAGTGTS